MHFQDEFNNFHEILHLHSTSQTTLIRRLLCVTNNFWKAVNKFLSACNHEKYDDEKRLTHWTVLKVPLTYLENTPRIKTTPVCGGAGFCLFDPKRPLVQEWFEITIVIIDVIDFLRKLIT